MEERQAHCHALPVTFTMIVVALLLAGCMPIPAISPAATAATETPAVSSGSAGAITPRMLIEPGVLVGPVAAGCCDRRDADAAQPDGAAGWH
jgi:hypothetical protein